MATFKADVQKKRKDGLYVVYIRCTHNRSVQYIKTDMYVTDKNVVKGQIKDQIVLGKCAIMIAEYLKKLNFENTTNWTVKEVIDFIMADNTQIPFVPYCKEYISNLRNKGKKRTADSYEDALRSFIKYFGEDIAFQDLTSVKINKWIETMMNTARAKQKYPTNIKAMFSSGELEFNDYDRGLMRIINQPFKKVSIPKADVTKKRAVEGHIIKDILAVTPSSRRSYLGYDVLKMIIYLVGINTVDLFYMEKVNPKTKKDTFRNGKLCYNRHKTESTRTDNAYIEVSVKPEIVPLIERYIDNTDSQYLFSFHSMYCNEKEFNKAVNKGIKELCDNIGIDKITTVGLRHTWATIAKRICKSDELVGFCLNHASAHKTSRIYINTDFTPIDELNNEVIDLIFGKKEGEKKKRGRKCLDSLDEVKEAV